MHASWKLLTHLLSESASCRHAVLAAHVDENEDTDDGDSTDGDGIEGFDEDDTRATDATPHDAPRTVANALGGHARSGVQCARERVRAAHAHECAPVLPALLDLVEGLTTGGTAFDGVPIVAANTPTATHAADVAQHAPLLLCAVRGLHALLWAAPAVQLPRLTQWVGNASSRQGGGNAAQAGVSDSALWRPRVFPVLLAPAMPERLRVGACTLLQRVLRAPDAFAAFITPSSSIGSAEHGSDGTRHPPGAAVLLAQALSARDGLVSSTTDESASVAMMSDGSAGGGSGFAGTSLFGSSRGLGGGGGGTAGDAMGSVPAAAGGGVRAASLALLSWCVASHDGAAERLLEPNLALALPMRLVSLLHTHVHSVRLLGRAGSGGGSASGGASGGGGRGSGCGVAGGGIGGGGGAGGGRGAGGGVAELDLVRAGVLLHTRRPW